MNEKRIVVLAFLLFAGAAVAYSYFTSGGEIYRSDSTGWTQDEANAELARLENEYDYARGEASGAASRKQIAEQELNDCEEAIGKLGGGTPHAIEVLTTEVNRLEAEAARWQGEADWFNDRALEARAEQEEIRAACEIARFNCNTPGNGFGGG